MSPDNDFFVLKLNSGGQFAWAYAFGGTQSYGIGQSGNAITTDAAGNVYFTGGSVGTVDFNPGPGTAPVNGGSSYTSTFICKLDAAGNYVWAKGFSSGASNSGQAIKVDAAGNVYLTANITGTTDVDPGPAVNQLYSAGGSIAYLPETNLTFGGMVQMYFRPKSLPKNRQSSIRLKGQYTLNKQYEGSVKYEMFLLQHSRLWLDGIVQYQNWLQEFYGIGNNTDYSAKEIIQFQRWNTDLRVLYKFKHFYLGPQARFAKVYDMRYAANSTYAKANLPAKDDYQTTGMGAALVFDTRDNNIFPFKGYYIAFSNYNHPRWASRDDFSFSSLEFDYRHFFNPRKGKHVLVMRAYVSTTFGNPPFRLNSLHGGQYTGRGYYEGRYTDRHLLLAQMEWRFPLVWRFRGVLFGSAGDVFNHPGDFSLSNIKWSVGAGLRFVLNVKERNSIRLDYAHGRSKHDAGFYFGVNEAY